ncbi:Rieske (2Fe-2S) protein [Sulfurirhabdus autotrophica]|uniref:Nitrite reductase/ring-hydroxylating ferredoxin subunit n=1 Tax=Sulfurirhabdus autotrophica TaxID=1706046 RepID=A0A4R3YGH9_9PROT|nr:Rieske 2Fe-2S domain-containing protein [Sulfurirhabdus autotrophica]TCV90054.1 nitrite reductase/ring-hydroxylating ferredoxin subunit [Sulfurirhabdus autotrophica]
MAENQRLICESIELPESGKGIRFTILFEGEETAAFVVRSGGQVHAYLNRCAHVPVELDWMEGEFFDDSGVYLICSTHGAMYAPDNGICVNGPCAGKSLQKLTVLESEGKIYYMKHEDRYV